MQQSQLRLGDILDDYCPRERRVTNHAIVAMVGPDVKQTRCTTCDAEHTYKHAKVPRQRKKADPAPLVPASPPVAQHVGSGASTVSGESPEAERLAQAATPDNSDEITAVATSGPEPSRTVQESTTAASDVVGEVGTEGGDDTAVGHEQEEGPVHRRLIRATLPRLEGQAPPARQSPDFTIRQPAGRANRFRPRQQRAGQSPQGNRNGNVAGGQNHGGSFRQPAGRQHVGTRSAKRHGSGRKRSK